MHFSAASLRIALLGEIRLEWDGRAIELPRRERAVRLFARLVLQPGRPQPRQALAFTLWPDVSETDALTNLRRHLYLLRTSLPQPAQAWLIVSTREVVWDPGPACWLDVAAFEAPADDASALERAAELYRGDLASGIDDDEILLARREQARQRYAEILKALATHELNADRHDRGLAWARRLVALDPWDEEAVRLKMRLEAFSGNRQTAVTTYEALAQSLQAELQTSPLPETMALYTDLIHNRVRQPGRRDDAPVAPAFVGRRSELRQLLDSYADVTRGVGRTVFVAGEAGSGKTALIHEALHRFQASSGASVRVLWGTCHPPRAADDEQPYSPWQQMLTAAAPVIAHRSDIPAALLNNLVPLVPDLNVLRPGLLSPTQPSADELRRALRLIFQQLATPDPLVLVFDDAQWADRASLDLLRELAEVGASQAVLLLVTHRSGEPTERLQAVKRDLRRRRCALDLALAPFTPEETRLFLETTLGDHAVEPGLIEELTAYAHGLPLLLREAVDSLADAWSTSDTVRLPTGLRDALRVRLERLPADAHAALQAAAVLGFDFQHAEFAHLLGWRPARFEPALDVLLARRLLVTTGTEAQTDYAFSHRLVHDELAATIPPELCLRLHAAAGRALETVHGATRGQAGRIARHYDAAGRLEQAAPFWLRQAEEVADLAAFDQARALIAHVVETAGSPGNELAARAAVLLATLAHYEGQTEQALRLIEAAMPIVRAYSSLTCQALTLEAFVLSALDRWQEGFARADEAVRLAQANHDLAAEASARNLCGICRMMLGQTREAVGDLDQARLQLDAADLARTNLYAQTLNHLGTALVFVQDYQRAEDVLQRTVTQTRAAGLRRLESAALTMLGQVALNRGRYGEAIQIYTRSIDVVGTSYVPGLWEKYAGRGAASLRSGAVAEALADFERGLDVTTQLGTRYGQTLMQGYLAMTRLTRRDPDRSGRSLREIEAAAQASGIQPIVMLAATLLGQHWRLLGDGTRSRAALERALQAAAATQTPSFLIATQAHWLQTCALDTAVRQPFDDYEALIADARLAGERPVLARALLARSAAALGAGRTDEALADGEHALTLARDCPDQPLIAEALLILAKGHAGRSDSAAASRALSDAIAQAEAEYWPLLVPALRLEAAWAGRDGSPVADQLAAEILAILGEPSADPPATS